MGSFWSSRKAVPAGKVFLERDDRLRPRQLALQAAILDFELFHARIDRLRHRAAPAGAPGDELPAIALPTPVGQVRAVQPFPTQQRSQFAMLLARVGFLQHAEPVLRREPAAL
jgi:hypothetical protein